jgi:hypothetical protein
MNRSALLLASSLTAALAPALLSTPARAAGMTLDQACTKFGAKVSDAKAKGDIAKAKQIYAVGNQRIADHFGKDANCPDVKAP